MTVFPRSLIEFQHCFPDEAACATYLFAARWPHGFICPSCGKTKAWELQTKPWTYECAGCGKQTSVTAGTIMHHSKLPLTTWFWAAYLMATDSNGIPALQLQRQLAQGSLAAGETDSNRRSPAELGNFDVSAPPCIREEPVAAILAVAPHSEVVARPRAAAHLRCVRHAG